MGRRRTEAEGDGGDVTLHDSHDHPAPWILRRGYDQCDPGYYIVAADNSIVLADTEGTLTEDTAALIIQLRNGTRIDFPDWRPREAEARRTIHNLIEALQECDDARNKLAQQECRWR